ncbi:MAG: hypothetical protein RLZZ196_785, partial [Bacteroidota bacterium]
MFYFDPVNDLDLDSYAYQLYDNSAGTGTPVSSGRNKANVFTVSVPNSNDTTTKTYWGRVAVVNTAGTVGTYTNLVSSGATPLIENQYISSLTAAKITAGTISGHAITLDGTSSIIQSSAYVADNNKGWYIRGDGALNFGGPNGIKYDPVSGVSIGTSVTISAATGASSLSFSGLTISAGASGIAVGSTSNNYWLTTGEFRTGTSSKYIKFDPAGSGTLTINGTVVQNGTVTGTIAGLNGVSNKLYIGSGNYANTDTSFYVDSSGNFSLKDKLYWDGTTLTVNGNGNFTGDIHAASGTIDGYLTAGGVSIGTLNNINGYYKGININGSFQSCFLRGDGGEVYFRADNGSQWIKFENGTVQIKGIGFEVNGSTVAIGNSCSIGTSASIGSSASIGGSLTIGDNVRIN